jgi:hypothetical protein
VGPRARLDDLEERKFFTLPELELRPLGRTGSSHSLYRLRYPGSIMTDIMQSSLGIYACLSYGYFCRKNYKLVAFAS